MAYVDVDKFAEAICKYPAIDEDAANSVIWLLRSLETADVVPADTRCISIEQVVADIKQKCEGCRAEPCFTCHVYNAIRMVSDLASKYKHSDNECLHDSRALSAPCKVGDNIYYIDKFSEMSMTPWIAKVVALNYFTNNKVSFWSADIVYEDVNGDSDYNTNVVFGKEAFLSEQEAINMLKYKKVSKL